MERLSQEPEQLPTNVSRRGCLCRLAILDALARGLPMPGMRTRTWLMHFVPRRTPSNAPVAIARPRFGRGWTILEQGAEGGSCRSGSASAYLKADPFERHLRPSAAVAARSAGIILRPVIDPTGPAKLRLENDLWIQTARQDVAAMVADRRGDLPAWLTGTQAIRPIHRSWRCWPGRSHVTGDEAR